MAKSFSALISPDLADTALSCTALTRARNLAEWVGPGKTLTASGVLRPAEAAQACRDLGIELPGPRLRSALDVEELMRDWVTATVAGFLVMDGRRARAAQDLPEAGSSTHADPDAILHSWIQAATFVLDLGEQPCAGCLTVLHELCSAAGPLTMSQLASGYGPCWSRRACPARTAARSTARVTCSASVTSLAMRMRRALPATQRVP